MIPPRDVCASQPSCSPSLLLSPYQSPVQAFGQNTRECSSARPHRQSDPTLFRLPFSWIILKHSCCYVLTVVDKSWLQRRLPTGLVLHPRVSLTLRPSFPVIGLLAPRRGCHVFAFCHVVAVLGASATDLGHHQPPFQPPHTDHIQCEF